MREQLMLLNTIRLYVIQPRLQRHFNLRPQASVGIVRRTTGTDLRDLRDPGGKLKATSEGAGPLRALKTNNKTLNWTLESGVDNQLGKKMK